MSETTPDTLTSHDDEAASSTVSDTQGANTSSGSARSEDATDLPIRMLHDRVLVDPDADLGERRSTGGILIPATVQMGRRMAWAKVVAIGSNVRTVAVDDRVLYDPNEKLEVELQSKMYVLMRERDIHAVAAERLSDEATGLYL